MIITEEMKEAIDLIESTRVPLYITGKAGTGKTTLLRYIVSTIKKTFVVAASTGIAAVNAGGTTLHSLLQIPFGCLTDTTPLGRFPANKRKLINSIDVLIIDEISMVRPDVMDFADRRLRNVRCCDEPFGGVQIVMFGDLYQLPPVVKADEEKVISQFYKAPYFFCANVFAEKGFKMIELSHIFRQSDERFIQILNNIRLYDVKPEDIEDLGEQRVNDCASDFSGKAIHICTHKRDVHRINKTMLGKASHTFPATLSEKFSPNAAPCDTELALAVGARVMMLTNDHEAGYCNGSLGYVSEINDSGRIPKVTVILDSGKTATVEPHTWEAYEYKMKDKEVVKNVVGTCTQLPIALAWAVTIHKSQGLTFEEAIVHSKQAFCPGQVYVALSRCTSLKGLKLESFITKRQIIPDYNLLAFDKAMKKTGGLFTAEVYLELNK